MNLIIPDSLRAFQRAIMDHSKCSGRWFPRAWHQSVCSRNASNHSGRPYRGFRFSTKTNNTFTHQNLILRRIGYLNPLLLILHFQWVFNRSKITEKSNIHQLWPILQLDWWRNSKIEELSPKGTHLSFRMRPFRANSVKGNVGHNSEARSTFVTFLHFHQLWPILEPDWGRTKIKNRRIIS